LFRQFYLERLQQLDNESAQRESKPGFNEARNGDSNLYFERDKLRRHLGIDPLAGLDRAQRWMASGDDDLMAKARLVFQDIPANVFVSPGAVNVSASQTQQSSPRQ
jgi:hypothetical protein